MASMDFYSELDLSKPEIAIAIQEIDRMNPGKVKFNIPVLHVDLPTGKELTKTVIQNKSSIQNDSKDSIDIKNLSISNYIEIPVPRELTSYIGGDYTVKGNFNYDSINGSQINISGSVGLASVSGNYYTANGSIISANGVLNLTPVDRYIPSGSKWVVMFIAGDINKPVILSRYLD